MTATEAAQDYNPQPPFHRLPAVYDFEYELESTRGRKRILSTGEGQRWYAGSQVALGCAGSQGTGSRSSAAVD